MGDRNTTSSANRSESPSGLRLRARSCQFASPAASAWIACAVRFVGRGASLIAQAESRRDPSRQLWFGHARCRSRLHRRRGIVGARAHHGQLRYRAHNQRFSATVVGSR